MYISSSSKLNGFYKLPKPYLFFFWPAKLLKGHHFVLPTLSLFTSRCLGYVLWRHILGFTFPCFSLFLTFSIIPHIPFGLPDVNCVARCLSCLSCLQGHSLGFTAKSPPSASQRSYLAVKPCIRSHDTF